MKRLIFSAIALFFAFTTFAGEILLIHPPVTRIGEESLTSSTSLRKSTSLKTVSSTVYYPVSAYVDEVALTVTFTQSVGVANVMVYNAMGQLVDMTSVDTTSDFDAILSTETWANGSYTLVVTYGTTTLSGTFDF